MTIREAMQQAFQALLRGDVAERDRLCAMVERAFVQSGQDDLPEDTDISDFKSDQ